MLTTINHKKMKKIVLKILSLAFILCISSCQDENQEFGNIITPTNIVISADIVGADTNNPNGDGSGAVNFTATADNATSFKYVINNNEFSAPNGRFSFNFSTLGVNTYTVTVVASGTAGVSTSSSIEVEVLSTYSPPAELLQKLHGGSSVTWRIKSEVPKHFGLGPVGGGTLAEWYGAGPDEKAGVGMYNDRYIFHADGTFEHITDNTNDAGGNDTAGDVFGRTGYIGALGSGGTEDGADTLNLPFSDYSESWFLTAPAGVETLTLTGLGFMGYYTGTHSYQIFDRSVPGEMILKITDANSEFDWWFIIATE